MARASASQSVDLGSISLSRRIKDKYGILFFRLTFGTQKKVENITYKTVSFFSSSVRHDDRVNSVLFSLLLLLLSANQEICELHFLKSLV